MAKSERQVDIAIVAKDEASGVFKSVAASAKEFNREAKASGEGAVEKLLKGGGALGLATFALEGMAKAAEGVREALHGVADGTMEVSQGIGLVLQKGFEGIPVVGTWVKGFREIEDAAFDATAAAAGYFFDADEGTKEAIESSASLKEHYEALGKAVDAGNKLMVAGRERVTLAGLSGIEKERAEAEKSYRERLDEIEKVRKEAEKEMSGKGVLPEERRRVNQPFEASRTEAKQELEAKLAEIDKKAKEEQAKRDEAAEKKQEESEFRHLERVLSFESAAKELRLREAGRDLDAELLHLETEHARELVEIQKSERDKTLTEREAQEERIASQHSYQERIHAAKEQDERQQTDKNDSINNELAAARLNILKQEANFGAAGAFEAARKLEIEQRATNEKEKLLKLLRDEKGLTTAQRDAAQQAIRDIEAEKNKALNERTVETQTDQRASLEESAHLQGFTDSQASLAALTGQLVDTAAEHKAIADESRAYLKKITEQNAAAATQQAGQPVFTGGA